jgi:hypothetical protein
MKSIKDILLSRNRWPAQTTLGKENILCHNFCVEIWQTYYHSPWSNKNGSWEARICMRVLSTFMPRSNENKSCMRVDESWLDNHQNLNHAAQSWWGFFISFRKLRPTQSKAKTIYCYQQKLVLPGVKISFLVLYNPLFVLTCTISPGTMSVTFSLSCNTPPNFTNWFFIQIKIIIQFIYSIVTTATDWER